MTRGLLYVATGAGHIAAAAASARSARRHNPDLAIAIFCDAPAPDPVFDQVAPVEAAHVRSKVDYLPRTPFAETLYLDTDTRVLGDLGDLFRLLERFDLAAAHRVRDPERLARPQPTDLPPAAFPEHNGGVILYRSNPITLDFLETWRTAYHAAGTEADQISFRQTLWTSHIRLTVMPPRFNTRRYTWIDHWFSPRKRPVILHTNRFHPSKQGGPIKRQLERLVGPMP